MPQQNETKLAIAIIGLAITLIFVFDIRGGFRDHSGGPDGRGQLQHWHDLLLVERVIEINRWDTVADGQTGALRIPTS